MTEKLVSIIIVNHNAGVLLEKCIESIFKTKNFRLEVILVDNASTDESHKKCKQRFPEIILIENKDNLGYCKGNNVGIQKAKGSYIVILNPDTEVQHDWLEKLFDAYKKHGEGLYQPKLLMLDKKDVFNSAGNMLHLFGFGYSRGKSQIDSDQFNTFEEIGYASGACLFTSSHTLKKIGLFDPFLFVYHDDLDLGWRAAHLGIKSYYVPDAVVYHTGSYYYKWSAFKFFLLEKNRHYCLLTHYSRKTFFKILPFILLVEIMVLLFYLSKGMLNEKLKGYYIILRNWKFILRKYQELEQKKIISDEELIKTFPDDLFISDVLGSKTSYVVNRLIAVLSKISKKLLLKKFI